jgi:arylsulfatase A-like enzyme
MKTKLLTAFTGVTVVATAINANAKEPIKPNILFIMTDQHNAEYFGFMGHPFLKTPNIDALARHAAIFGSAYCASPVSGPSRAAVFTGRYPLSNGVTKNWVRLKDESSLLTNLLSGAGYETAMIGKLHLTPVTDKHGFEYRRICDSPYDLYDKDEIVENDYLKWAAKELGMSPERLAAKAGESEHADYKDLRFWLGWSWTDDKHQMTTWTGNEAVSFIDGYDGKQPFFLHVSFFGPHHPYSTSDPWDKMYDPEKVVLPPTFGLKQPGRQPGIRPEFSEADWKRIIATYCGNISAIDAQIGRIINTLKEKGLWDNTLIVFTSDHGDHMGDFSQLGKGTMLESSVNVPLLIKAPGKNTKEKRQPEVVNLIDLYNTLLDYAGVASAKFSPESRSLKPVLSGKTSWKNQTFSSYGFSEGMNGQVMNISNGLKCVAFYKNGVASYELYDLKGQIPDLTDVSDKAEYQVALKKMESEIEMWMKH